MFLVSVLAGELFAANSVFRVCACTNANKRCICVIRYHRTHYEQLPPCNSRLQTAVTQRFGLYTLGLTSPHSRNVSTTNPRAFLLASWYPLLPIFFFSSFSWLASRAHRVRFPENLALTLSNEWYSCAKRYGDMVVKIVLGADIGTFKGVEACNIKYFGDTRIRFLLCD